MSPSDRQIGDAVGVIAVQKNALDEGYMLEKARELGLGKEVSDLLAGKIQPKST